MNIFKFKQSGEKLHVKPTIVESDDDKVSVVTLVREFIAGDVFLKETVQKQYLYVL